MLNPIQVSSYAAIREVGRLRDGSGHLRLTLNGQPIFHLGTLDQGWWPDGLLTPPSDSAQVVVMTSWQLLLGD
jgi:beta-galactosidase